ncbi:hypothetical protein GCM10027075_77160 [Streptomyces heilongjiangensis]
MATFGSARGGRILATIYEALRRVVEFGTSITQMGHAADDDVDEIVNRAQAEIFAVT